MTTLMSKGRDAGVEAMRQRAALRGEEAVARWRMRTAAWSARVYAILVAIPILSAVLFGGPAPIVLTTLTLAVALIIVWISFLVARGSMRAAAALLGLFLFDRIVAFLTLGPRGLSQGIIVMGIVAFGSVQGVWGGWSLRNIERARDAESHAI